MCDLKMAVLPIIMRMHYELVPLFHFMILMVVLVDLMLVWVSGIHQARFLNKWPLKITTIKLLELLEMSI